MRSFLRLLLLLAVFAPAGAASPAPDTPEAVVERYFEALNAEDWDAAAAVMHPDVLTHLQTMYVRALGADGLLGEFYADQVRQQLGVESVGELEALSPARVFARYLGRSVYRLAYAGFALDLTALGHVPEGDDLAHVVARIRVSAEGGARETVQALSLRRYEGEWRMLLPEEGRAELAAMEAVMEEGE